MGFAARVCQDARSRAATQPAPHVVALPFWANLGLGLFPDDRKRAPSAAAACREPGWLHRCIAAGARLPAQSHPRHRKLWACDGDGRSRLRRRPADRRGTTPDHGRGTARAGGATGGPISTRLDGTLWSCGNASCSMTRYCEAGCGLLFGGGQGLRADGRSRSLPGPRMGRVLPTKREEPLWHRSRHAWRRRCEGRGPERE